MTRCSVERREQIQKLIDEAGAILEEARALSEGCSDYFYFDELGYGAGASLCAGEWLPSSQSC